ncbi:HBR181Cp [Eremothecium sinecaudum]|uniref:HBR181Cp n=1 Tax=Eremothecium sinecaudum TaxID=45286 RepID=A0A120K175_9SACH|nr:HBR181Cp [Eremothecium sinecaudum]AMD19082.1 HBR181Cp [Eremothecium sinecaudum]
MSKVGGKLIFALCVGIITTGTINSVITKFQDNQCIRDCATASPLLFNQPLMQTLQMFIAEALMLPLFYFTGKRKRISLDVVPRTSNTYLLSLPAICDVCGSTLLNLSLILVPVSIFQMARGAVIVFVAVFSAVFLNRSISRKEWVSMAIVVLGVAIVGLSGMAGWESNLLNGKLVLGISFVLVAQVFLATQLVLEEYFVSRQPIMPMELVGYEGVFGTMITSAMFMFGTLTFARENTASPFNFPMSYNDLKTSRALIYTSIVVMISVATFNFLGIALTKHVSATSRSMVDTCRTIVVWLVSLVIGWETFKWKQLCGFTIVVFGTLMYNNVIDIPVNWDGKKDSRQYYEQIEG